MEITHIPIDQLKPFERNPKKHPPKQINALKKSFKEFGWTNPILVCEDNMIIAGHGRVIAAKECGFTEVPAIVLNMSYEKAVAYVLADNHLAEIAETDNEMLAMILKDVSEIPDFDFEATGFTMDDLDEILNQYGEGAMSQTMEEAKASLSERFLVPPFSILDTRQGYWQDRKRNWVGLGLRSDNGRDAECLKTGIGKKYGREEQTGVSIFDPVLCEVLISWFTSPGFRILDPFAGGSVRGIVSNILGRHYTGIDLRQEQIDANVSQGNLILPDNIPNWICGDSMNIDSLAPGKYDFVFSCPPYADLEVYSDDPRDISNMGYTDFMHSYKEIITKSCSMLENNRFACFVVGDIRDNNGFYRNFVSDSVKCFVESGLSYYNDSILINSFGTAPVRAGNTFGKYRKLVKVHQNVLIFVKGDPKKATEACGPVEVLTVEPDIDN